MTTKDLSKKFGLTEESVYDKMKRLCEELRLSAIENNITIVTVNTDPVVENIYYRMYKSRDLGIKIPEMVIIDHVCVLTTP